MKKIIPFLKPYWKELILTALLSVVSTIEGVFLPSLMSRIVDTGIAVGNMGVIWKYGAIMLALAICSMLCALWTSAINAKVSAGFSHDIKRAIFRKATGLSFETFSKIGTSGLLTRSTHDVTTISDASTMFVNVVIMVPILMIGGAAFAMLSDRVLGLVLLIAIVGLVAAIVPELISSIKNLLVNLPEYLTSMTDWINAHIANLKGDQTQLYSILVSIWDNAQKSLNNFADQFEPKLDSIASGGADILSVITSSAVSVFKWVTNFLLGIIISIYLLYKGLQPIIRQVKTVFRRILHRSGRDHTAL
mgnify:CR=1 FL=1